MVRSKRPGILSNGLAFAVLSHIASAACTICSTESGQKIRQEIFSADFTSTLLAVIAPAPILLFSAFVLSNLLARDKSVNE
jgi:hypothetical protein